MKTDAQRPNRHAVEIEKVFLEHFLKARSNRGSDLDRVPAA